MHQSLSCDHPVKQLPSRVAGAGDDVSIGLRRQIIERQRWNGAQHGVEPRPANNPVRRLPIDYRKRIVCPGTALELSGGNFPAWPD